MFTLQQIQDAHAKVKSGADFPAYIQDLIALGVKGYDTYVTDGHTVYYGDDAFTIITTTKYEAIVIADTADSAAFESRLRAHQQGQTDYPTFCNDCAATGIEKWTVDMNAMTCTYYDMAGNEILQERIPS